jgi:hypothetical protein
MRNEHRTGDDPRVAHRLNEIGTHAGQGLRDLRDAIERLETIETRWRAGDPADSVSFNNAAGRVVDAAYELGAALAIVRAAPGASNEDLLAALQGETYFSGGPEPADLEIPS